MTNLLDLLTEDEARAILDAHVEDLRTCLRAGWADWRELGRLAPRQMVNASSRSRATVVYDGIIAEAARRFRNKPGVTIKRDHGFMVLIFDGRLVLRFKKYRYGLRTSGIPTQQQMQFSWQAEMEGLPPAATKVVAGYLLNRLQDEFRMMAITCKMGPNLVWVIEIPDAPGAAMPIPTLMRTPPGEDEPTRPTVRPAATDTPEVAREDQ